MSIAIITDISCGLTAEEAKRMRISFISSPLMIDGEVYFEGASENDSIAYDAMNQGQQIVFITSNQLALKEQVYSLLRYFEEVLYISSASELSSAYMIIKQIAEEDNRVYIFDSRRISVTLRMTVLEAFTLASKGYSSSEIIRLLENHANNFFFYFVTKTTEYLKMISKISCILPKNKNEELKNVMKYSDGKVEPIISLRASDNVIVEKIIDKFITEWRDNYIQYKESQINIGLFYTVMVTKTINEHISIIKKKVPLANIYYSNFSISLGSYTGPDTFGLGISFSDIY